MINNGVDYHDLGGAYFLTRTDPHRLTNRLVGQLNQLGFQVVLNPIQ